MSAAAKPPAGRADHKEGKFPKVPEEWNIELPGRGADRFAQDAFFGGCRSIEKGYAKGEVLGHGTYGEVSVSDGGCGGCCAGWNLAAAVGGTLAEGRAARGADRELGVCMTVQVFLATDYENGDKVAAKKIKMDNEKEGFPITAIREIKILSALANAQEEIQETPLRNNVITLREIVRSGAATANDGKGSIYMIFDYMDHDLAGLLERQTLNNSKFIMPQTKCYVRQLLFGLALLQHKKVLHRDLKNANLLVNNSGELKIADFGLARYCQRSAPGQEAQGKMTNRVITLWYRPPELFLGSEHYGSEIDIWSAGCIMAELLVSHWGTGSTQQCRAARSCCTSEAVQRPAAPALRLHWGCCFCGSWKQPAPPRDGVVLSRHLRNATATPCRWARRCFLAGTTPTRPRRSLPSWASPLR